MTGTHFAGYDFDLKRLAWYDWAAIVLLAVTVPPAALGYGIAAAAAPVEGDDD
jgi:hypothetical protein